MISHNLRGNGRAICKVAFQISGGIRMRNIDFKIDTGADFSTLSKKNLYYLGYDDNWIKSNVAEDTTQRTTVASGEQVKTHYVQLPLLNFYGYEAINWPFAVLLDDRDYRPLLGLDLLGGFNFTLDNANDCFTLTRIESFKRRRVFLPNQEIHEIHTV